MSGDTGGVCLGSGSVTVLDLSVGATMDKNQVTSVDSDERRSIDRGLIESALLKDIDS